MESMEKHLELRSEVCNVAGSKINIQKPIVFLYTTNEQPKLKFKKQCNLQQHQIYEKFRDKSGKRCTKAIH